MLNLEINALIFLYGGSYELYIISKDSYGRGDVQDAKKGPGGSAMFVDRNRFAVLDKSTNQALLKNLKNEIVKKSVLPIATDSIFYAGTGNLLCRSEDRVVIFDLQQRLVVGDLQTPFIKYVVWSNDMESVALLSKHAIIIASKKLVHQCTLHETIRVKSGGWDDNGVFIYTTLNHIKYCLPNGDSGIIKTLDATIYITKVSGITIFCLDRDGKSRSIIIDATEYIFKLSLLKKRYDHVMNMIRNSQLCGQAMIAYLQQKGFPEVVLHFVKDERIRFNLALESGNIQIAVASATAIAEKDHWYLLGVEALCQGNAGIVEYAYQRTKIFERSFASCLHHCISPWLHDVAERLAAELGDNVPSLPEGKVQMLLMKNMKGMFDGDWVEELDIVDVDGLQNGDVTAVLDDGEVAEENDEEDGWEMEDLELPPEADTPKVSTSSRSSVFVPPTPGIPVSQIWIQRSSLAADHAAVGNFDTAMRLLNRQLGIRNFAPLKSIFLDLNTGSHSYLPAFSFAPEISLAIERGWTESSSPNSRREVDEVKELVIIVKEYVLGIQIELQRREIKDNPAWQQELAAYFTHCNLQPPHLRLALLNAMVVCFKEKNLATAYNFARRLLETNPTIENQAKRARQVVAAAEKNMNDTTPLNYDHRNPFVICGGTYVPIYRGQKDVSCPYCTSRFVPSHEGQLCTVCDLAVAGADASGMLCSPSQIR
ncbi:unnamed protein product [Lupinus luteus]|uniref:Uncharacterized protein n=1 Tax=Lupinus luteus TaxID=3873 RepID=A0AAV1Y388_LUPLU